MMLALGCAKTTSLRSMYVKNVNNKPAHHTTDKKLQIGSLNIVTGPIVVNKYSAATRNKTPPTNEDVSSPTCYIYYITEIDCK